MVKNMAKDTLGTTAHNRPHKSGIHYSAKGYDEYRADLVQRFESRGFVLRDDDFIHAFIDLTAYLGEVLMTYQNAYAQEIYLETAQLRESLFNFALVVDYRIDPGAAAVGTLILLAKPDKAGTLPKGFQISGKEEGAEQKVFFETDNELKVMTHFNEFSLADSERYDPIAIGTSISLEDKLTIKTGSYLYFHAASGDLFIQVQAAAIDPQNDTTQVTWTGSSIYSSLDGTENVADGSWGYINPEGRDLLKLEISADNNVWLDGKFEKIAVHDPLIVKKSGAADCFGVINGVAFEMATVKTGVLRWISTTDAGPGETRRFSYTIKVLEGSTEVNKTFYALEKNTTETREVTRLTVDWIGCSDGTTAPSGYDQGILEKSPEHVVYVGLRQQLKVQKSAANMTSLAGDSTLKVTGDFSAMEKYRPLILHGPAGDQNETEPVGVKEVEYDPATDTSYIDLKTAVSKNFKKHTVKIWGNVVKVSQGKSIAATVLGSGWGEESFQSFDFAQSPLTYERRGREGIQAAVDIKVNDLPWQQKDDFLYSGPGDRHFAVQTGYDGQSRIVFGDGANGAKLPTGRDNVIAGYRIGQGSQGNVSDKILKKPTSKPAFLKEVFNTGQTTGGSDADTREKLRARIPVEHLTFDRAVSLSDYADLALAYPGVGKAKAGWRWLNNRQVVYLAVIGEKGQDLTPIMADLRNHLDVRRDINQPLLVQPVCIIPITIVMEVVALEDIDADRLEDRVTAALGTGRQADGLPRFFNFERLALGMSIHKKDIYQLVERISGVKGIKSLAVARSPVVCSDSGYLSPALCAEDVWIQNWELAELDQPHLEINILQPPVNKVCATLGI
jgi:hypothetical protein